MSIRVENLKHIYDKGLPTESLALENISFEVADNELLGVICHTGSGKSTLLQQMVNTAGCLVALISSVLCLLDSALWQTGWIDRAFSFGLLALPLAVIADTIIIFRARKRLRKWIQLTKGKKHLNIKEKREAMRRMEE